MSDVDTTKEPYIFISYRRADSMAAARGLLRFLHAHYGRHTVFMDTAEIRAGTDWPSEIDKALRKATVLLPIIGPNWFRLTDKFGSRRIDKPDDWVAREIAFALKSRLAVIPIYVNADAPDDANAFPKRIRALAGKQARMVRDSDSGDEWRKLAASLREHGFGPLQSDVRYPAANVLLQPFTDAEIRLALRKLSGWSCVSSPVPGMEHVTRTELHKSYEFLSFDRAIEFMSKSAAQISKKQHHPRWENIWRTVSVWLATWDLQFQVSQLDVDLAQHLDEVARELEATPL